MQVSVKVTTFVATEQLELAACRDVTGDFSRLAHVSNFTRVKVVVTCIPEDQQSGEQAIVTGDWLGHYRFDLPDNGHHARRSGPERL